MGLLERIFGRRRPVADPGTAAATATTDSPTLPRPAVTAPAATLSHGFAVVDVETTGLSPKAHRVLELAIVTCDPEGRPVDEWVTRLDPQGPVGATHVHGISEADVLGSPLFADVLPNVAERLQGRAVVAHNARFDLAFLRSEFGRAGWSMPWVPSVCTLEASHRHLPELSRRRLPDCCTAARVTHRGAHSALGDARATAGLLAWYLEREARLHDAGACLTAMRDARAVAWPTAPSATPTPRSPGGPSPRTAAVVRRAPRRRLASLLADFRIVDAFDDDAPEGTASYLELLAEVLEDGVLDDAERAALADVATVYGFDIEAVEAVHRRFVGALAVRAVDDGRVVAGEWEELRGVGRLLDVPDAVLTDVVDRAAGARVTRLSSGLAPLPDGWQLGEPLRVDDSVVFTGCEADRTQLEDAAERAGVRVVSAVSGRTALLVSDGTVDGTKAAAARRHGTRVVTPEEFRVLLAHIQPPVVRVDRPAPRPKVPTTVPTVVATVSAGATPAEIRDWARRNGFVVNDRGRLPKDVVDAFAAAARSDAAV